MIKIDKTINVKGLLCPQPTVMALGALKCMGKGEILEIISDDNNTMKEIPLLCRKKGYNLIEMKEKKGLLYFIIQR